MFIVKKSEQIGGNVFPDEEYLKNYEDSDFGSLISTMGIESLVGNSLLQLGDSGVFVEIASTDTKGDEGMEVLKKYVSDLAEIIEESLSLMRSPYSEFYRHFVTDYQNNGLSMPVKGKLI